MTLDVLSSIKGAKASKVVDDLFEVIKQGYVADVNQNNTINTLAVELEDLRSDVAHLSPDIERQLIIENFPKSKNDYLVVSKVIEE